MCRREEIWAEVFDKLGISMFDEAEEEKVKENIKILCEKKMGKNNKYLSEEEINRILDYINKDEEENECEYDNVNKPKHYNLGKVECIDAIESATIQKEGIEAVCTANIIKYLWRYESKNGLEDVRKAKWYLNRLIEILECKE